MGVDAMMRGINPHKPGDSHESESAAAATVQGENSGNRNSGNQEQKVEVCSMSYLSVPDSPKSRRPSTADLVIEKLQVEHVEGGGVSIQGVALAGNCHIALTVFGVFFLVAGIILSYISYNVNTETKNSEGGDAEAKKSISSQFSSVSQMRMIGPLFLALGLLMVFLGLILYLLAKKISRDEKAHRRAVSQRQLSQLENSFSCAQVGSPLYTSAPQPNEQYPILAVRRQSIWMEPTPVESPKADDNSADNRDFAVQCPSPHGESNGFVSSPHPSPDLQEANVADIDNRSDIACFPHPEDSGTETSTVLPRTASPPNLSFSFGSDSNTAQDFRGGSLFASGASQEFRNAGYSTSSASVMRPQTTFSTSERTHLPSSNTQVPSIQVTSSDPPYTSVPILPRLSRHCSTRLDSRPTTAEPR